MTVNVTPDLSPSYPSLRRRLLSMIYESLLLFSLLFTGGYLFDTLTQSNHALFLRGSRQAFLFLILGLYFVWFWTHGGQTLPMKTWRIRLVCPNGDAVPWQRACLRYLLAFALFVGPLGLAWILGLQHWEALGVVALGTFFLAFSVRFDRDRQFLYDRLAGTRLVNT